jgi:drug/metabolite transporter (DMT)-like permease
VITSVICIAWLYLKDRPTLLSILGTDSWLLWVRGALTGVGLLLTYTAFNYLDLSTALTVFHLRPFPTALLCYVFLNETFGRKKLICCGKGL